MGMSAWWSASDTLGKSGVGSRVASVALAQSIKKIAVGDQDEHQSRDDYSPCDGRHFEERQHGEGCGASDSTQDVESVCGEVGM